MDDFDRTLIAEFIEEHWGDFLLHITPHFDDAEKEAERIVSELNME